MLSNVGSIFCEKRLVFELDRMTIEGFCKSKMSLSSIWRLRKNLKDPVGEFPCWDEVFFGERDTKFFFAVSKLPHFGAFLMTRETELTRYFMESLEESLSFLLNRIHHHFVSKS